MPTVKELLVKYKIDTSNWKTALQDVRAKVKEMQAEQKASAKEQSKLVQDQLRDLRIAIGQIRSQSAEHDKIVTALKRQQEQQKLLVTQANARVATERAVTAQIQSQTAALRLQAIQAKATSGARAPAAGGGGLLAMLGFGTTFGRGGGQGGGFLGGVLGGFSSRLAGTIGFAVLSAEGIGRLLERLAVGVKHLAEETAALGPVEDTFNRLGNIKGIDTVNFLNQLRQATHDLVPDMELMRVGNAAMQSGLKISTQQVSLLVGATLALARSQGHDAQEAMQALERSFQTGYFRTLAYVTGIQSAELTTRGMGTELSRTAQRQQSFNMMLDVLQKKLGQVGDPALTVVERLRVLSELSRRFFEETFISLSKTTGFQEFLSFLGDLATSMRKSEEAGVGWGQKLGQIFAFLTASLKLLGQTWNQVSGAAIRLVDSVNQMVNAIGGAKTTQSLQQGQYNMKSLASWLLVTYDDMLLVKQGALDLIAVFRAMGREVAAFLNVKLSLGDMVKEMKQAYRDLQLDVALNTQNTVEAHDKLLGSLGWDAKTGTFKQAGSGLGTIGGLPQPAGDQGVLDPQYQLRIQKLRKEVQQAGAKEEIELNKVKLQQEQQDQEAAYQAGQITLQQYIQRRLALLQASTDAELKLAKMESQAQLDTLNLQKKLGLVDPQEYRLQTQMEQAKARTQAATIQLQADKEAENLRKQLAADELAAKRAQTEADLKLDEAKNQNSLLNLKDSLDKGLVTVSQYIEQKKALLQKELADFVAEKELERQEGEKNKKAMVEIDAAEASEREKILQQIHEAESSRADLEIKKQEQEFQKRIAILQLQLKSTQVQGLPKKLFPEALTPQPQVQAQIVSTYAQYIAQLEGDLKGLVAQGLSPTSEKVLDLKDKIIAAKNAMETMTQKMADWLDILSGGFSQLGAALAPLGYKGLSEGVSRGVANIAAFVGFQNYAAQQVVGGQYSMVGGVNTLMAGTGKTMASDPLVAFGQTLKDLVKGGGDLKKTFGQLIQSVASMTQSAVGFVQAMTGQGGPLTAGIGGLSSGLSLGENLGGLFSKFSALAGPIGGAVGAVVGGVIGIFSGKKQASAEKIAKKIVHEFEQVSLQLSTQTINLATAIQQQIALRQQAIDQLSGRKGGRDQLANLLPQFNQQIAQLQAQQIQIFQTTLQQIQVLSSPVPYQEYVQSIQSIIDTWNKYIQAGGDAATANQFLTLSFQKMATDGLQTLNQDQQQAIQDALNYNDLLIQRQNLIIDTQQQIADIVDAGAPMKRRTQAQIKLLQIARIQQQADLQMQQLNQEIALTGYKLQTEQKIFGLATTRIGLEAQLLVAQEKQADQQMAQIAALTNVLQLLGNVPSLAGVTGLPPSQQTLAALNLILQALGLSGVNLPAGFGATATPPTTENLPISPQIQALLKGLGINIGGGTGSSSAGGTGGVAILSELFKMAYRTRGNQGLGTFSGEF